MAEWPPIYRVQLVREGTAPEARPQLESPATAAAFLVPWVDEHCDTGREVFGLLMLDTRHRLIGLHVVSVGCLTASLVHPREVFAPAVVAMAAGLVLWHTHPSGDPEPSAEDLALTRRLSAAGALMGIEVLEHVIVGMGPNARRWVSLKDRGML